jgi:hypothetical protein
MTTILQNIGQNLRVVGPLTLTNWILNPNFESGDTVPDSWNVLGDAVPTIVTTHPRYGAHCLQLSFPNDTTGIESRGIIQICPDPIGQEIPYYFLVSLWIDSALTVDINGQVDFYDVTDTIISSNMQALILAGNTTDSSWADTYITVNVPIGAVSAQVSIFVNAQGDPSTVPNFYVASTMFTDQTTPYIDGDTAGYIWSGDRYNSTTLESTIPSDLSFFNPQLIALT